MRPLVDRNACGRRRCQRTFASCGGLLVVPLLLLAGCSDRSASGEVLPASVVVPVSAATATQRDMPVQIRAVGNVQAISSVVIKSQVDGQVLRVHFAEGQNVRTGDVLFTLDPDPFEAALR